MRLSPQTIKQMSNEFGLITPITDHYTHKETGLSGGLSCAGYDVHLKDLKLPTYDGELLSTHELKTNWDGQKQEYQELQDKLKTISEDLEGTRNVLLGYAYHLDELMASETPDQQEIDNTNESIQSNKLLAEEQQNEIRDLQSNIRYYGELKHLAEKQYILEPNGIVLGSTVERFTLPKHISMTYFNKSTLARRFIDSAATLGEPDWHGHLTLEIKNNSHVPVILQLGQPIGQIVFDTLDKPTDYPYSGKYQNQSSEPKEAE